jgi:hypothetical protein
MLSDQELIDRLRGELAPLLPPPDLVDRLRAEAASDRGDRRRLGRARHLPGSRRAAGPTRFVRTLRRPVNALPLAISVLLAVGIGAGAVALLRHRAPTPPGQQSGPASNTVILTGDGLGGVGFGASPARLLQLIEPLLGPPSDDVKGEAACGVDRQLTWPILLDPLTGHLERSEELLLTFDRGRFAGYQYGGFDPPRPGHTQRLRLRATTARGLAIGDSLASGQRLYGRAFQISAAQGGSWQARTPYGTLRGYAYDTSSRGVTSPSNLVASINGGTLGCPAMNP